MNKKDLWWILKLGDPADDCFLFRGSGTRCREDFEKSAHNF
jgi:hypothetical protein